MYPRYQYLTQTDMEKIYETSLRILEEVGVMFAYTPARELLKKHGCREDGQIIRFPRTLVEDSLKTVPSEFIVHARNPKNDIHMNTEETFYCDPGCSAFVTDIEKGRRYSTEEDFINIVKIVHSLNNVDIHHEVACEMNDVDNRLRTVKMNYYNLKYTDKPFLGTSMGYERAKKAIEMTAVGYGDPDIVKEKSIMFSIPCSLTPLGYDENMAGAIMAYAEYGQAQIINSLPISGATGPATYAGCMALQGAEIFAGIVLAQCVNPGCPVIYSSNAASADMATGSMVAGSPEYAVFSMANGQFAKFLNIPCRVGGGLSDSKIMDAQAAYESAIGNITGQFGGGNFILGAVGFLETYNSTCYEKLIIDNEIIGYIKHIAKGLEVNDDTLAFDVIKNVGPQGEFLTADHTFTHFRKTFYHPFISNRQNAANWEANSCPTLEQAASKRWKEILESYEEPTLPADVDRDLQKYLTL